ncbi:MAG: carbohydrate binding domain-containing protein [Candidatus Omnitrophota bacterium]|nr:carbohydrate binding domain-containing protein [Candidatus Omnitrophota bacterium]
MKIIKLIFILFFSLAIPSFAQEKNLLIEDFENPVCGGENGTVDFGSGSGSSVEVTADTNIKNSGAQSLKITFDAVSGGYMWIAKGFGLDAKNTAWLVTPEAITWEKYSSISFYAYGSNSKTRIAFDIKDNGNEMWRFIITDDFTGWKQIVCLFNEFFARGDWQPQTADANAVLDFPIKSFQFEPLAEAKSVIYIDTVELTNK